MQDCNDDGVGGNNKVNRVGKPPKKRSPDSTPNLWKLKWTVRNAFKKGIKP